LVVLYGQFMMHSQRNIKFLHIAIKWQYFVLKCTRTYTHTNLVHREMQNYKLQKN